jgi:hypothetical protein
MAGLSPKDVDGAALASVVPPLTGKWVEVCRTSLGCEPLVVDAGVRTGVRIRYEDPKAVGADRVVDAAAAFRLYGGPAIIVDFGTATTFDCVSQQGAYLGGAIAPGVVTSAEELFRRAARIPRRTFEWLLNTSIPFNRYLLVQVNERLGQFIGMVEHDRQVGEILAKLEELVNQGESKFKNKISQIVRNQQKNIQDDMKTKLP